MLCYLSFPFRSSHNRFSSLTSSLLSSPSHSSSLTTFAHSQTQNCPFYYSTLYSQQKKLIYNTMTQLLINQGTLFHNILLNQVNKNQQRVSEIGDIAKNLINLLSTFSQSLNQSCRKMFHKLKVDEDEDQSVVFLSKFIIDLLTQLSKKLVVITKKIENEVVNPYDQFVVSQNESSKELVSKSADMLACLEANSSFLSELNKNFSLNQNMDLSEIQKKQLKQIYQSEMEKCNEKWLSIKKGYNQILTQADSSNSFRINFTVKIKVKTAKLLNKLVSSPNVEEPLNGYEDLYEENENLSLGIKEKIRDIMGKSILLEQKPIMEQFDGNCNFAYQDKKIIDDFISFFTSFSLLKEDEQKHEKARILILQNNHWAQYFLTRMRSNLHTQIKLPNIKYHQIITIIKYLFASCAQSNQNQAILYNLLFISYRLSCNGVYAIRQLGKHEVYWQNVDMWIKIIKYIRSIREQLSQVKKESKQKTIRKIFKGGWNWMGNQQNKMITEKKIKSQRMISDAKQYEIVCEINYFLARLQLKQKLIFDMIIKISVKFGFSTDNTKKLLKFHYFNKQNNIDKLGSNMNKRKKKLQQKYRNINKQKMLVICVGKCIKYLQLSPQLVNLRLVNSQWSKHLKNKIFKRFLIQERNQNQVNKIRIHIYNAYPPVIFSRQIFERMLEQLPDFIENSDIINLDVKRSLSWDQSLRDSLVTILQSFSFYNPNIGYLQGMNYLCQNILKLTDDRFIVYRIFEYLMTYPFYGMFTANFDGLRTKIYQFMRVIQRQKPKLYAHFQIQKLQGEHFLLPWAITLWGQMSGDLCWLMWDGFMCKGWKWWIKVGLWLLNILEPQLLQMNFEGMMKCFSELSTGLFAMNARQLKDFGIDIGKAKQQINAINLEGQVLVQIEKEYKLKVSMLNDYLKKMGFMKKSR